MQNAVTPDMDHPAVQYLCKTQTTGKGNQHGRSYNLCFTR